LTPDTATLPAQSSWQADRARYPARGAWRYQPLWAIAVYRFGRWNDANPEGLRRRLLERVYWAAFVAVEVLTKISMTKAVEIGPGLRIVHFGPVVVNERARIGANCTIEHGVTIGIRHPDGPVPVIGDDVEIGPYAQILGGVHVGDGAKIGAMTVVLDDVPAGATAVGVPARVVSGSEAR
jgi:serine O-acetyltransferase